MNEVWKQMVLDHYRQPRHFAAPPAPWLDREEHNRTCGDHVHVYLEALPAPGRGRLSFTGAGCSLCIATASLMCELLQDVDRAACTRELANFERVWERGASAEDAGPWQVIAGLRQYPVRSRCVRLPWQALSKIVEAWPA